MNSANRLGVRLSVVSHRQNHLANQFLDDLALVQGVDELVFTENVTQGGVRLPAHIPSRLITNPSPLGFAGNHNQAFVGNTLPYFCVANPDLRLHADPLPRLLACFDDPQVGVVAPLVLNPAGLPEDNARHFPTPGVWAKSLSGWTTGAITFNPRLAADPSPSNGQPACSCSFARPLFGMWEVLMLNSTFITKM
ncbi:MAG: hypothetical protein R3E56_21260 [Burkholderiaceae bacterium]